jgi:hypothetical protein
MRARGSRQIRTFTVTRNAPASCELDGAAKFRDGAVEILQRLVGSSQG